MRRFLQFLTEEVGTNSLYHAIDSWSDVAQISRLGYIPMSFAGTGADSKANKGYPYFLSASRVPTNSYRYGKDVTLVLDADKIRQRYRVYPLNYYGFSRKDKNEAEDRIVSRKDKLPIEYIKEVHMLVEDGDVEDYPKVYSQFIGQDRFVDQDKVYVYEDPKAYAVLDTRKAMSMDEFREKHEGKLDYTFGDYGEKTRDELADMVDFLQTGGKSPETSRQKAWRREHMRGWNRDFLPQFSNIIHNAHRRKSDQFIQRELKHLARYMQQEFPGLDLHSFLEAWHEKHTS